MKIIHTLRALSRIKSVKHLMVVIFLLFVAVVVQSFTYNQGYIKANQKMTRALKYAAIFPDSILKVKTDFREILIEKTIIQGERKIHYISLLLPPVANCKVARIHQQLTDVALKAHHHLTVTKEFMVQSFVCNSAATFFFILGSASLAFITKSGFAQANPYLLNILICSIAIGSFFVGLSNVFKQEQNANDNLNMYIKCIDLEQKIRTELSTNNYILQKASQPCDTTSTLNKTIEAFDAQIANLNGVKLGFNIDALKTLSTQVLDSNFKP
ncbi:MAG: hypothetical protein HOP30_21220 [Cyclobacteriaceae bacterium]|nr:hypothetical protein [Cyclobacteriaceae bacterium]